ncbi:hypothetical protein ECG_03769 [Echinococcus granulosus]|uniref:Zinc finger C2H2 type n=1 Tax=Echinococcus granulosus TaxID=6210 RepID=A0A068WD01_ECHGR|nr:hypothetical protein ECG_03769 [Echinococcus granulosus]CDS17971.1 zinc finger C2H2 type [Echinococcus granulosus]
MPCVTKCEPMDTASPTIETTSSETPPTVDSDTKRQTTQNSNADRKPTPPLLYPDIRLPLEMKLMSQPNRGSVEKPALRATCDISVGHIWGPYRIAQLFRSTSPPSESNPVSAHRQITVLSGDACDLVVRVNEENAWIKLVQEPAVTDASNVEIIFEIVPETISVVSLTNIASGSQIRGAIKLVPPNSSGASRSGSPSPPAVNSSCTGPSSGAAAATTTGGPKRDKKCLYCGIFFSSLDTLTAHMTNYCSRRPRLATPPSGPCTSSSSNSGGVGVASSTPDKGTASAADPGDPGVSEPMTSQASAFSWPSRTTPGKRLNGLANPHSPHNTNRSTPCASGGGASTTGRSGVSPPCLSHPPPDLSSVLAAAAVGNTTDPLVTFAATLASLGRCRAPPVTAEQQAPHQLYPSAEEKSRALYCRGCQRFYSNSIFSFHVGISRHLNKLAAEGSADVGHLADAAKRLGLVMTAPLITDAGFVYVPVHPVCGGGGSGSASGVGRGESGGSGVRAPLDLRTAKSTGEETATVVAAEETGPTPSITQQNATNSLLATIISGLVSKGMAPPGPPPLPPPPPPPVPPPNWWFGGKFPDAAALEAFLQAMASGQSHQLTSSVDIARTSTEGSTVEVQRPYLCTNCQTRFQAYTTFKAHQQYYCQGRRKGSMASENAASSHSNTTSSTPQSTKSSTSSERSHSPKRRRLAEVDSCPMTLCMKPASPLSQGDSSETSPSSRSLNGDWEHVGGGSSELRCRLCGYIGQTTRGMKMHNRLHECTAASNTNSSMRTKAQKPSSPKSPSAATEANSSPPQSFPTQPLC